jgi:hypothetical protein
MMEQAEGLPTSTLKSRLKAARFIRSIESNPHNINTVYYNQESDGPFGQTNVIHYGFRQGFLTIDVFSFCKEVLKSLELRQALPL